MRQGRHPSRSGRFKTRRRRKKLMLWETNHPGELVGRSGRKCAEKLLEKLSVFVVCSDVLACKNYGGAMWFDPCFFYSTFARFGGSPA
jgi:hypothetical protein